MTLPNILGDFVLFYGSVFGLGFLWWPRWTTDATERLTWAAALGLMQLYAGAWVIYLTGAPQLAYIGLPLLAVTGLLVRRRAIRDLALDPDAGRNLGRLLLFAGWCLGWLSLVRSYGGGEWVGDWLEHYRRARFFIDHQPLTVRFLGVYGLTARPPLANLVVAAGMELRGTGFAHAQVFLTLFGSLTVLPALLLARHFAGSRRGDAVLLVMLMFSPMVVQNATFAWTKLPSAFFVVAAIAFFVRGWDEVEPNRRLAAVVAMAGGVLTHYSAAPYAIGLGGWYGWRLCTGKPGRGTIREAVAAAVLFAGLLSTWLAWAGWHFGAAGTFLDNSTVTTDAGMGLATRIGYRIESLYRTLLPHPLLPADYRFLAQFSREGYWRDYAFTIYQTTLPGALGLAGWVWLAISRTRPRAPTSGPDRQAWVWFVAVVMVLGFASISWADRWGIAHVAFLPLVLLTTAALAGRREERGSRWRWLWWLALAFDAAFGLVMHFHLQATALLTNQDATRFLQGQIFSFSQAVGRNTLAKVVSGTSFVADGGPPPWLVAPLLVALAVLALRPVFISRFAALPPSNVSR